MRGVCGFAGGMERMGVSNSASVRAAASMDEIHSVCLKPACEIHFVSAVMYSVPRDLYTGARCWITTNPASLANTAKPKRQPNSPGHYRQSVGKLTFESGGDVVCCCIARVRGTSKGEAERRIDAAHLGKSQVGAVQQQVDCKLWNRPDRNCWNEQRGSFERGQYRRERGVERCRHGCDGAFQRETLARSEESRKLSDCALQASSGGSQDGTNVRACVLMSWPGRVCCFGAQRPHGAS